MKRCLIIFLLCVLCQACQGRALKHDQVCFKKKCFEVEVVDTDETRRRGLQFCESLNADSGMLFVFENSSRQRFWMKDTLIPLDMIWMDYAQRIIHIEKNVPPCRRDPCPSYGPDMASLYVLEFNAGFTDAKDIQLYEIVEFKLKKD